MKFSDKSGRPEKIIYIYQEKIQYDHHGIENSNEIMDAPWKILFRGLWMPQRHNLSEIGSTTKENSFPSFMDAPKTKI